MVNCKTQDVTWRQKKFKKSATSVVILVVGSLLLGVIFQNPFFSEANAATSRSNTLRTSGAVNQLSNVNASIWLHTDGTKILNANDEEVIWNGINSRSIFGYWIYAHNGILDEYLHASDITIIRGHGLNFVRVWIALNQAVYGQAPGTPTKLNYYQRFWTLLDEIVNAAMQSGVWVSIDFHLSDFVWANVGGAWGDGSGFPRWMYDGSWSYFNKIYTNDVAGRSSAIRDFWNTNDPTAENVRAAFRTFWKDIVTRYKDAPNVVFSVFNEPMETWDGPNLYRVTSYSSPSVEWQKQITMFQGFMENLIDVIRAIDGGKHVIIVNQGAFPSHDWNPQIRRSNIIVEDHYYLTDLPGHIEYYAQNAFRYDQPFELGEFGGIEQNLQSEANAILSMQTTNKLSVGWVYLWYDPGTSPSKQTWTDIESNLRSDLKYY